jgi:hypothetical protein
MVVCADTFSMSIYHSRSMTVKAADSLGNTQFWEGISKTKCGRFSNIRVTPFRHGTVNPNETVEYDGNLHGSIDEDMTPIGDI